MAHFLEPFNYTCKHTILPLSVTVYGRVVVYFNHHQAFGGFLDVYAI